MKLKFIHSDALDKNLKASVHKTGKLGFTTEAAQKLSLSIEKTMGVAINEEDSNDKNLYIVIYPGPHAGAFRISKAGAYYYIQAKALFDTLKIDYVKESVVYDISEYELEDAIVYRFKRRENRKKENS